MMTKSRFYQRGLVISIILAGLLFTKCRESAVTSIIRPYDLNYLSGNKDLQLLGEKLFFDTDLSDPEGQSCAACHSPEVGWTGPDEIANKTKGGIYEGATKTRFGNRKPNSAAYATLSPLFHAVVEGEQVHFIGGNFWDGRATGNALGNPAADQAQGPFLNPLEQNVPDARTLVDKVCRSDYSSLFIKVGKDIWGIDNICEINDVNMQYGVIGIAIAAFENSEKVNQFSSKYDYYLKGQASLTAEEKKGLELFDNKGKCSLCHTSKAGDDGKPPLFTDFTFDNLGIPKNPDNPFYSMDSTFNPAGKNWTDPGLAEFLRKVPQYAMFADENLGKHQVPTLRNVDKRPDKDFVKAYCHNGYFRSLEEIVHFYNTRDLLPAETKVSDPKPGVNCWPEPEVVQNMNKEELGNLGLTAEEESAIVAFLKALSDGYSLK
jgi:cytochrome c peroxidase